VIIYSQIVALPVKISIKTKEVIRWIGVFPIAVACLTLAPILFNWISLFFFYSLSGFSSTNSIFGSEGLIMTYFAPLYCNGAAGAIYIVAGATVAPARKKIVSLVLLVIIFAVYGYLLIRNLFLSDYFQCLVVLSTMVGSFISHLDVNKNEEN
jgi:hypothetical protein